MNEDAKKSVGWPWLWSLLILILLGGLIAIAIPNSLQRHPNKFNWIINNLRQLDAAKNQWAFEHERGITNFDQISRLTNQLAEQDLIPYLNFQNKQTDFVHSVAGEIYTINPLNKSPEVKLVHEIGMPWPKGSIIRFSTNANFEVTSPDGTKIYF